MRLKVESPFINSKIKLQNNYRVIIGYINDNRYYFSADFLFAVKLTGNAMIL